MTKTLTQAMEAKARQVATGLKQRISKLKDGDSRLRIYRHRLSRLEAGIDLAKGPIQSRREFWISEVIRMSEQFVEPVPKNPFD